MNFTKETISDYYLLDTEVENIFINEYMTAAPGDYVKVYLFALMYAETDQEMTNEIIAKQLRMDEEDVLKAWTYWENLGVIRKRFKGSKSKFDYAVSFISLKESMYGKTMKAGLDQGQDQVPSELHDEAIKEMYREIERITGRPLGGKEPVEIISWITEYGATPEMVIRAYDYCCKTKKKENVKYIGQVVKGWIEEKIDTPEKIQEHIDSVDLRHSQYKRVMKALGFTRNATEEEKRIMDIWFGEMELPITTVLDACSKTSGIPNPNIKYVNAILTSNKGGRASGGGRSEGGKKTTGINTVLKYYDYIRNKAEKETQERTIEIYKLIPRIKAIDDEARKVSMQISKVMLSGSKDGAAKSNLLKQEIDKLLEEKAFLLAENNYEITYLETKYRCDKCGDTGTLDTGERCECFSQRMNEAEEWQISSKTY